MNNPKKNDNSSRSKNSLFGVRQDVIVLGIFVVYVLGAHLRLTIYNEGEVIVPFYLMLLAGLALGLLFMGPLMAKAGGAVALLVAFVCVQPFVTFAPNSGLGTLHSALHMIASILTTSLMLCALITVDRERLYKVALWMWIVIIVLALTESLGLKPFFDQVRDILYSGSGRFIYASDARDIEIYGRVRNTVFATEPSFLADTLCILIVFTYVLDNKRVGMPRYIHAILMFISSFALAPSFKMVFYLIAVMAWHFWPQTRRSVIVMCLIMLSISILGPIVYFQMPDLLGGAIGKHLSSGSFYGRIEVGPIIGWNALKDYPIFGYGIGNTEGLSPIIFGTWQKSDALYMFPWFQNLRPVDLMTNGFWWQWVYLGIIGGGMFVVLLQRWLRSFGVERPFRVIVCTWIVWYAGFAFIDPVSWLLFIPFSLGAIRASEHASGQKREGAGTI